VFKLSKYFEDQALRVLRELPADQAFTEIPTARGFFACRGETAPEGYALIAHVQDGDIKGLICQKI
jgi:hypothetical protein